MSAPTDTRRVHRLRAAAFASAFGACLLVAGPVRAQVAPPSVPLPALPGQHSRTAAPTRAGTQTGGETMSGTFRLTAGSCTGAVRGSYFRMIQPGGSASSGPYV